MKDKMLPWRCRFCDENFEYMHELKKHQRVKHREEIGLL